MQRSTVASLLRTSQAFAQQLCQKETLDYGIAFYSEQFPGLPEANQFREVVIEDPARTADAFAQTEDWFARQGLKCFRWAPADGQPLDVLGEFLTARGFQERRFDVMTLTRWPDSSPAATVRVLPARAVRPHFRATFAPDTSPDSSSLADAHADRLDDASYDAFVAMLGDKPAGRCALYQVGDLARVMDVTVLPDYLGQPVTEALLLHALALARRLALRATLTQVPQDRPELRTLMESLGFTADGWIIEYHR